MSRLSSIGISLTIIGIIILVFGWLNPMFLSNVKYETGQQCKTCGGDGIIQHLFSADEKCKDCDGTGKEKASVTNILNPWLAMTGVFILIPGVTLIIVGAVYKPENVQTKPALPLQYYSRPPPQQQYYPPSPPQEYPIQYPPQPPR